MPLRRPKALSTEPTIYGSDLDYLQDEMAWVEARCKRIAVERRLDVPLLQTVRSRHYHDEDEAPADLRRRLPGLRRREATLRTRVDDRLVASREMGKPVALDRLCATWDLGAFERQVLLLALATTFSESFTALFGGMLNDGRSGSDLSVEVAYLFSEVSFADRVRLRKTFAKAAPLVQNDIIVVGHCGRLSDPGDLLGSKLALSPGAYAYLLGDDCLGDDYAEFSSVENPMATLDQVVLDNDTKRRILSVVQDHDRYLECRRQWGFDEKIRYGRGILMLFHGPPGTGKTLTAHAVASAMGKRLLNVDIPTFVGNREADKFLPGLFREARLRDALLFFDECEVLFADRRSGNQLMSMLLTELERFEGVAILATNLPEVLDPALNRRILVKVRFPSPDRAARREIWRRHLPSEAPLADDVDVEKLSKYELSGGYIKNSILVALADAVHGGEAEPRITMQHLDRAAREQLQSTKRSDDDRPYRAGFRGTGDQDR